MKIRNIHIKNFRSLHDLVMDDVGDLTILIGSNSSGKSNLLEALKLFFNELDPAAQRNIGAVNDYIWFDRNPKKPVEFRITIELSKDELEATIPKEILRELKTTTNTITIVREISGTPSNALWRTREIKVNDTFLIKEGKFVYKPHEEVVPAPAQEKGKTSPSQSQTTPPTPDFLGTLLQNVAQNFKGKFKLIEAARDVVSSPTRLGDRVSFIQPASLGRLNTLAQTLNRPDERKWIEIDRSIKKVSPHIQDIRYLGGQITMREKGSDMHFPISLMGGGDQEVSFIIHQLLEDGNLIFGIEEPELHLHPQLARQLFNVLKEISRKKQIFITTHSTIFIDQSDLSNTWIVRKVGKETEIVRIKEPEGLKNILYELGVRPSDIFYTNGIIFVEGPTEKLCFLFWHKKWALI